MSLNKKNKNDIENLDYVILDVETTGLSPRAGDRIVEFAAIRVRHLKEIDRYETLIDPQREISYGAFQVNGITSQLLSGAPKAEEVLEDILHFIEGACLVGHNIPFDLKFLNNEFLLADHPAPEGYPTIDTIKMARNLLPQIGRYSLRAVAAYLGVKEQQRHRAMADVQMTYKIFCQLLKMAQAKHADNPSFFFEIFGAQKKDPRNQQIKRQKIKEAITANHPVEFSYFSSNSGVTSRTVTPQELVGEGSGTLLVGFCHLRREKRIFKLEKMMDIMTHL